MNASRRKFLKYGIAAAGAAALGLAGYSLINRTLERSVNETTAVLNSTQSVKPSGTKAGLVLRGKHWYGYNLDGVQSEADGIDTIKNSRWKEMEPDEPFYLVVLDKNKKDWGKYSSGNGEFQVDDLPAGTYTLIPYPCAPSDLQDNSRKILDEWFKKLDPWGIGKGDVYPEYEKMVKDDPKKLVYIWHRFFTIGPVRNSDNKIFASLAMGPYGNSGLYNVRDGLKIDLKTSITDAAIESGDGFATLPFDSSRDVNIFQGYHHPDHIFADADSMKVRDWTGKLVYDGDYAETTWARYPHNATDLKADCNVPVRLPGPGEGYFSGSTPPRGAISFACYHGIDPVTGFIIDSAHYHLSSSDKSKLITNLKRGEEIGKNGMTGTYVCHDHNDIFLENLKPGENQPKIILIDFFAAVWPIRGYLSNKEINDAPNDYTIVPFDQNPCIYGMWARTNKPPYPSLK